MTPIFDIYFIIDFYFINIVFYKLFVFYKCSLILYIQANIINAEYISACWKLVVLEMLTIAQTYTECKYFCS